MATAHKSRVLDMTQGDPFRLVLQFSMPLFCSNLLQQLYNLTDTALAGHLLGSAALAEIGATAALYGLIMNFAFGMNNGLALTVSRIFGAGDESGIRRAVGWMVTLSAVVSLVLTGCSLLGRDALLTVLQVPAQAWDGASAYLTVILLGIPLTMLYNMEAALLRAVGNSVTPLLFLLFSSVLNVGLDAAFMGPLGLGVRGAAIATVLSQAVGAAWIIRFLTGKKTILRLRRDYLRPEKQIILPVLALGISSFVMLSTESLLSISFSSSLARYGGDVAVGAMTVITSASQLCTLPIQGICQGGQPVMSFNFGAGKKARVKEAFRFQLTLCGSYTCLFWLLMMLFPGAVAGIFTSDTALIQYTTWAMRIYMAGIFAMGFQIACQQSFMALGQAKVSLLLACLRKIILLIPLIFILPHVVSDPVFGVFLAEPVSDILAATITTITFFARFDKIWIRVRRGCNRCFQSLQTCCVRLQALLFCREMLPPPLACIPQGGALARSARTPARNLLKLL